MQGRDITQDLKISHGEEGKPKTVNLLRLSKTEIATKSAKAEMSLSCQGRCWSVLRMTALLLGFHHVGRLVVVCISP